MFAELIIKNKEFLKLVYSLAICFISLFIFLKSDRLFKISDYQGIRYFRNAFFFYGLAFLTGFILGNIKNPLPDYGDFYFKTTLFLSEFFLIFAGFFLLYSLVWKYFEKEKKHHSIFNLNISLFGLVSLLFSIGDLFISKPFFMYLSQITLFFIMSIFCYKNYLNKAQKNIFSAYYFLTILLGLFSWLLNAAIAYLHLSTLFRAYAYLTNAIFFLLFLYLAVKITKK